jgi:hypothetical protein
VFRAVTAPPGAGLRRGVVARLLDGGGTQDLEVPVGGRDDAPVRGHGQHVECLSLLLLLFSPGFASHLLVSDLDRFVLPFERIRCR